jgi:hypothetical protein
VCGGIGTREGETQHLKFEKVVESLVVQVENRGRVAVVLTDQWGMRHVLMVEIEGGDNCEWGNVGLVLPFPSRKYVKECECDYTFTRQT